MTVKGWDYYMRFYQGYGPEVRYPPIGPSRTVLAADPDQLARFLAAWPGARDLHVVIQQGQSQEKVRTVFQVVQRFGFRESFREASGATSVIHLVRRPAAAPAGQAGG
jgi:hypothetical protein